MQKNRKNQRKKWKIRELLPQATHLSFYFEPERLGLQVAESKSTKKESVAFKVLEQEYASFFTTVLGWPNSSWILKREEENFANAHIENIEILKRACEEENFANAHWDYVTFLRLAIVSVALDHSMVPGPFYHSTT